MNRTALVFCMLLFACLFFTSCSDDGSTESGNKNPVCTITSPADNSSFEKGTDITIKVNANDTDGEISKVLFYLDGEGIGEAETFPYEFILNTDTCSFRSYIIKAVAKDKEGAEQSDEIAINIVNNAPQIIGIIVDPSEIPQGGEAEFICTAFDYEGDVLTYNWSSEYGTVNGNDSTMIWTAPGTHGTYKIFVTVSDNEGSVTDSISVNVYQTVVYIQGGSFQMGDHYDEGETDELPLHNVTISGFHIGKYEITQYEWDQYMPSPVYDHGEGIKYPVYKISWYEIIKYCNIRSIAEGLTPVYSVGGSTDPEDWGPIPTPYNYTWSNLTCNWPANGYRLPTEAEWEFAARGGINSSDNFRFSGCQTELELRDHAWYSYNSSTTAKETGTKLPNQLGLYDMSGNVFEWCWDWYGIYSSDASTNPLGPSAGSYKTVRGGSTGTSFNWNRVSYRNIYPDCYAKEYFIGFRVARTGGTK
ncbi:MAG TPA: SUMF1/EgtB/PvdO family nonheme iron enzyme [Clostridiales bacterium]|nr:SUMF1/EgtB/PvdO family nonheme iron enzyme [Clostridiales bacterium]HQP68964.1 SUMF1/EgtB/PvdO family nonheme iron enzyme [Clostridiales bacterium]